MVIHEENKRTCCQKNKVRTWTEATSLTHSMQCPLAMWVHNPRLHCQMKKLPEILQTQETRYFSLFSGVKPFLKKGSWQFGMRSSSGCGTTTMQHNSQEGQGSSKDNGLKNDCILNTESCRTEKKWDTFFLSSFSLFFFSSFFVCHLTFPNGTQSLVTGALNFMGLCYNENGRTPLRADVPEQLWLTRKWRRLGQTGKFNE